MRTMEMVCSGLCSLVSDSLRVMDCSLPGYSAHGISLARVLVWGAISYSREPS